MATSKFFKIKLEMANKTKAKKEKKHTTKK